MTLLIIGLVGGLLAISAWLLVPRLTSADPKTPSLGRPELVLIAPTEMHRYKWVPLQRVSVDQGILLPANLGVPIFRLKNLSNVTATGIKLTWRIAEPNSIRAIFLTSERFKRYGAAIDSDGLGPFHLANKDMASGSPASDEEIQYFPFVEAPSESQQGINVPMPISLAYGYAFRVVAGLPRPDKTNQPEKGGGLLRSVGPSMEVTLEYRVGEDEYTRRFRVESSLMVISETAYDSGFGGNIEPQYWSEDNFRAMATFTVIPRR